MIYPSNFETKIGFDRVRKQITELCTTAGGAEKLLSEKFCCDYKTLSLRLHLSEQMLNILMMEHDFPNGEYTDISHILQKNRVEGIFLDVEEILAIKRALNSIGELVRFFMNCSEELYPDLVSMSREIDSFPRIMGHIDSIIDKYGKLKDSASVELYDVRRAIRSREGQVSKRLQQIMGQAQSAGYVDGDASISIREGRAVIPVSAVHKRKIKGLIHDESATGKTFYIEPVEIVELNNELRELEYRERREILRILTEFTDLLRPEVDEIEVSADYLIHIDMIRAKSRYAYKNECVKPIISTEGVLNLRKARHPLLMQALKREDKDIVPLDITLTKDKHILVISGPNAGGKSVCLKSVGLLQYMFQCGILIPAGHNSEIPIFDSIFIDIGDEQSIDNDLSTYSSHLQNMKNMLQHATSKSLILIDEFGTGTEPIIGGSIAESILEKLEYRGSYGVITTHYSNLKYYASNAEGIANGAMTFDVQNIRPLFQLEMGMPGSSFAIEIARKIGLPEEIIKSASEKAGSDHISIERQLREIARDKRYWELKRNKIRIADKKIESLEERYSEQLAKIKEERSIILKSAKEEAQRLLSDANKHIESTIKTIKESQADKEKTRFIRKELEQFKDKLDDNSIDDIDKSDRIEREMERLQSRQQKRAERKQNQPQEDDVIVPKVDLIKPSKIEVGCKVKVEDQDTVGVVQSIKGSKITISFGHILTTVHIDRLTIVSNNEFKKQQRQRHTSTNMSVDISQRKLNFKQHIDVRGMRAVDALEAVESLIDDAIMVGVSQVTILHGKGTGALKNEIRSYLKGINDIESAEDERVEFGGSGITLVKFRQ